MSIRLADINAIAVEKSAPANLGKHIEAQHLFNQFQLQPTVFLGDIVQQAFSNKHQITTPLFSALTGSGNSSDFSEIKKEVISINTDEYEWYLSTQGNDSTSVVENLEIGNPAIGYSQFNGQSSTFRVKFKHGLFTQGDNISPADLDYQCRVVRVVGGSEVTGFIYELQLNSARALPISFVSVGATWIRVGLAGNNNYEGVEVGGNGFRQGDVLHRFRNRLGEYKLEVGLSRKALNTDLSTSRMVANGKQPALIAFDAAKENAYVVKYKGEDFINYGYEKDYYKDSYKSGEGKQFWFWKGELMFFKTWYELLEQQLWYGQQYTNTHTDASGHILYSASGVRELLKFSNQSRINHYTSETYEEFLSLMASGRYRADVYKLFTGYAGSRGIEEFDKVMKAKLAATNIVVFNKDVPLTPVSSAVHKNAFAYGYQITEYHMVNNITLRLMYNPIYDNTTINRMKHPQHSFPLESWKITFLNLDLESADKQNVALVKNGNPNFHVFTGIGSSQLSPSHKTPYDQMMIMGKYGIWIKDLTACGEISLSYTY